MRYGSRSRVRTRLVAALLAALLLPAGTAGADDEDAVDTANWQVGYWSHWTTQFARDTTGSAVPNPFGATADGHGGGHMAYRQHVVLRWNRSNVSTVTALYGNPVQGGIGSGNRVEIACGESSRGSALEKRFITQGLWLSLPGTAHYVEVPVVWSCGSDGTRRKQVIAAYTASGTQRQVNLGTAINEHFYYNIWHKGRCWWIGIPGNTKGTGWCWESGHAPHGTGFDIGSESNESSSSVRTTEDLKISKASWMLDEENPWDGGTFWAGNYSQSSRAGTMGGHVVKDAGTGKKNGLHHCMNLGVGCH